MTQAKRNGIERPNLLTGALSNMSTSFNRFLVLAAGLCGAAGVGLSAAAAHAGGAFTGTAASFLLMHAPAFLAIGLLAGNRVLRIAGLILFAGVVLFSGDLLARDLLARDFLGTRLFPMAAPAGGTLLIIGWLAVAASAFVGRKS